MLAVAAEIRHAGVVIPLDDQPARKLRQHHAPHAFAYLVDVEVRDLPLGTVRGKQAIDQCLQAIGLGDDHPRVLALLGHVEFRIQQLRCPAHATQRILDFVRQIAQQLAVGLRQPELPFLSVDLQLLLDL